MAKKRVHEIAKERGISSKEVIAVLQKAGLDVKAAASSVDENDIAMAFSNGSKAKAKAKPADDATPAAKPQAAAKQPSEPAQQPPRGDDRPQRPTRGAPPAPGQGSGGGGGRRRRV